jgi:hypothetical protein
MRLAGCSALLPAAVPNWRVPVRARGEIWTAVPREVRRKRRLFGLVLLAQAR